MGGLRWHLSLPGTHQVHGDGLSRPAAPRSKLPRGKAAPAAPVHCLKDVRQLRSAGTEALAHLEGANG